MNRYNTGRMPSEDFIACLECGLSNPPSVQERPVTALQIPEAADLVGTFEGEMQAGDRLVEGKHHVSFFAPPDAQELIVR